MEESVRSVTNLSWNKYTSLMFKLNALSFGAGRAATYRDNCQKLLEDLSKFINFKVIPEVDADSQQETGFWNITTLDHQNQVVDLVFSTQGVPLSKDFGKLITPFEHTEGSNAQLRQKLPRTVLGHIEVLDGGSQHDDTNGPILFAITPPTVNSTDENDSGLSAVAYQKGEGRWPCSSNG